VHPPVHHAHRSGADEGFDFVALDDLTQERIRDRTDVHVPNGLIADLRSHGWPKLPETQLEATASRLARSSAISGGVLERMVTIRRGLLALVSEATGGSYESSGRAKELDPHGVRLRQQA